MTSFYQIYDKLHIKKVSFCTSKNIVLKACLTVLFSVSAHREHDVLPEEQAVLYAQRDVVTHVLVYSLINIIIVQAVKESDDDKRKSLTTEELT